MRAITLLMLLVSSFCLASSCDQASLSSQIKQATSQCMAQAGNDTAAQSKCSSQIATQIESQCDPNAPGNNASNDVLAQKEQQDAQQLEATDPPVDINTWAADQTAVCGDAQCAQEIQAAVSEFNNPK